MSDTSTPDHDGTPKHDGAEQHDGTDPDGTTKPDGLGDDSTIPNHPEGVAAGFADDDSHFNQEEDEGTE